MLNLSRACLTRWAIAFSGIDFRGCGESEGKRGEVRCF